MRRHDRGHVFHHRRRVIRRRLELAKFVLFGWKFLNEYLEWARKNSGRLSKWNLVCSCRLCRGPKYRDARAGEKRLWRREVGVEEA